MRNFASMEELYAGEGRAVYMQRLALDPAQLERLMTRLTREWRPENRSYTYNWFSANCSTRIRDVLDDVLEGRLRPQHEGGSGATKRSEVLRHVGRDPWVWLGLDYAMALDGGRELDHWETTFLPERLRRRLRASTIEQAGGAARPLIDHECRVRDSAFPEAPEAPPSRDGWLWAIGLWVGALIARLGLAAPRSLLARRALGLLLVVYGVVGGALGAVSVLLWSASALTIFWRNTALAQLSPATLLVAVAGALAVTGRGMRVAWSLAAGLAVASLLGLVISPALHQATFGIAGLALPPLVAATWALRRLS